LGLLGSNGTGKSTALKILSGKMKPNLGRHENPPEWSEIIKHFRGSELQNYFKKLAEGEMKATIKPQYVDGILKVKTFGDLEEVTVNEFLEKFDQRGVREELIDKLELREVLNNDMTRVSGGQLQRIAIAATAMQDKTIYMFDEPTSYLDIKQRLRAAEAIRSVLTPENYVIAVEHDLSILDYLSNFVCCLYGDPGAYGIVTMPSGVREGINIFLDGYIPTENVRFRDEELTFKFSDKLEEEISETTEYKYPTMEKKLGQFNLKVEAGSFNTSQITVLLGENGTGKTTFVRMLAGIDQEMKDKVPELNVSYKPQMIAPKFQGTVEELLAEKLKGMQTNEQFVSDVIKPMNIQHLLNNLVTELSGGELQRVALILALGKPADVYLLDEPSAYLDSEQRLIASKVIKRFIFNSKKAAFVVEHDFIMATYLADRVIVFEGEKAINCVAKAPESLLTGMNKFLGLMGITFKRDPTNFRPRINKLNGRRDREQKKSGNYFVLEY